MLDENEFPKEITEGVFSCFVIILSSINYIDLCFDLDGFYPKQFDITCDPKSF